MNAKHPFKWIKKESLLPVFVVSLMITIFIIVAMQILGMPLMTEAAPAGIVTFEFAGDLDTAQAIIASWGHDSLIYAGLNLGFDYLFMVAYGITIGSGCVLISERLRYKISLLGILLAWGSILAALLDALENYALIRLLLGSINETWAVIAKWCAGVKFILVAVGIVYVLFGALYLLLTKNKRVRS
jgi:hypothetical protein